MAKFNATTLIVLALVINSVAGLPIETLNINERDMELEPRGRFSFLSKGFGLARKYLPKAANYLRNSWRDGGRQTVEQGVRDTAVQLIEGQGQQQYYLKRDLGYTFGDGALGSRDLEERSWSDLDAREYLDMDELD
ncbi:hypothetical protein F5887DRAFT_919907 [Amanita rubescens]|nr:hypothetical protein F5887DRAFT_919907 [Amanita rubescens]